MQRLVYASSSSVYGDSQVLPKREGEEGHPLSPYAVTKAMDEAYAGLYKRLFGLPVIGLRFFNVFGERQDPQGPYAAVYDSVEYDVPGFQNRKVFDEALRTTRPGIQGTSPPRWF